MPIRLDTKDQDFAARFDAFLATKREVASDVEAAVRAIIADVAKRGDRALVELSKKFDRADLQKIGMKVLPAEIDSALASIDAKTRSPLEFAKERIETHHRRKRPEDLHYIDAPGV